MGLPDIEFGVDQRVDQVPRQVTINSAFALLGSVARYRQLERRRSPVWERVGNKVKGVAPVDRYGRHVVIEKQLFLVVSHDDDGIRSRLGERLVQGIYRLLAGLVLGTEPLGGQGRANRWVGLGQ